MAKETTNNELARMVAEGFKGVDKRFDEVDKRFEKIDKQFNKIDDKFEQVDNRLEHIDARLDTMSKDIAIIKEHFVYRHEFNDLLDRVKYLEEKMGIDSGK